MSTVETPVHDTYAGRLDITALPACQPAVAPLYPPFPWKSFNSRAIAVVYETDLDAVLDLLPPELSPLTTPPQVVCLLDGGAEFCSGGGSCAEMSPLIPVLYKGEPHLYRWIGYLGEGSEEWLAAGREVLGDARKCARVELTQQPGRGLIMGTVERPADHRLVTLIVGPLARQCEATDFVLHPILSLRVVPDATGAAPQRAELLRRELRATIRRAADGSPMIFSGTGTVVLGVSEQDPLYRLPVRRATVGHYIEFGTVAHEAGEVVESYA